MECLFISCVYTSQQDERSYNHHGAQQLPGDGGGRGDGVEGGSGLAVSRALQEAPPGPLDVGGEDAKKVSHDFIENTICLRVAYFTFVVRGLVKVGGSQ